jgi:hypothetical protein
MEKKNGSRGRDQNCLVEKSRQKVKLSPDSLADVN